jgi:hypothetical protein
VYPQLHRGSEDDALLQRPKSPIPLRSMVHDIGPVLTHRVQIVRLALEGKTTTQICAAPAAVTNYVSTFTRCAQLAERGLQPSAHPTKASLQALSNTRQRVTFGGRSWTPCRGNRRSDANGAGPLNAT